MRFMKLVIMVLMALNVVQAIAAPPYVGPGCDEQGKNCLFGRPSKRVQLWSKSGPTSILGKRCENFIGDINAKKELLQQTIAADLILEFRNFTYSWTDRIDSEGRADIRCSVEIHSENPNYLLISKVTQNFNWTCEDKDSAGICMNYMSQCLDKVNEDSKGENVLSSRPIFGGSLLQGNICSSNILTVELAPIDQ